MLEIVPTEAAIVACHGDVAVLDGWGSQRDAFAARVAGDELWLVGARDHRAAIMTEARARLWGSGGLVLDQTDGWVVWTLRGETGREVLGRLLVAPLPAGGPTLVQGAISGVAGKVISAGAAFHLMVPAPVGHHLRDRILAVSGDLETRMGPPAPFSVAPGRRC